MLKSFFQQHFQGTYCEQRTTQDPGRKQKMFTFLVPMVSIPFTAERQLWVPTTWVTPRGSSQFISWTSALKNKESHNTEQQKRVKQRPRTKLLRPRMETN